MTDEYTYLRSKVESFIGYRLQTRRHFDMLAETIYANTKSMLSATTLRRFWGYQEKDGGVSLNTLNVLSRLVGYHDYEEFCSKKDASADDTSSWRVQCPCVINP